MNSKSLVARRGLALGAGQCIFFLCLRMQEYREVLADLLEAGG